MKRVAFSQRIITLILSLLAITICMPARAADPTVTVSPRFDIFVGPGDQTYTGGDRVNGLVSAFDAANNRFLVVWTDQQNPSVAEVSLYARLVNPDGSSASDPFVIANGSGLSHMNPNVAYDPNHKRFLVLWDDSRYYSSSLVSVVVGQLVNVDGTFSGENFIISPPPCYSQQGLIPQVSFDTANNQFLVVWWGSLNVYGRLVPADGLPANGNYPPPANPLDCTPLPPPPFVFAITDYVPPSPYSVARPRVQFDSVNTQYLVTCQTALKIFH